VETVNETGEATNIGEEGDIIVTGLKNAVFPLIRYKTEDRGFFDSKGFLHITMSRSNDYLYYQEKVFDGSIFWAAILHLQQQLNICIGQFQVRHKCNVVHVSLIINNKLQQSNTLLAELISEFLFVKFQIKVKVIVEIVDNIAVERDKNKLKYFINEDCCEVKTNGK
jgi:phenylacetate-coenzyme A ligase PaaK-like adenylate-forming protein